MNNDEIDWKERNKERKDNFNKSRETTLKLALSPTISESTCFINLLGEEVKLNRNQMGKNLNRLSFLLYREFQKLYY